MLLKLSAFMRISSRQKLESLNDETINITADDVKMNQTDHSKALGPNIDENLSWKEHINAISKKVASSIGAHKQVSVLQCSVGMLVSAAK